MRSEGSLSSCSGQRTCNSRPRRIGSPHPSRCTTSSTETARARSTSTTGRRSPGGRRIRRAGWSAGRPVQVGHEQPGTWAPGGSAAVGVRSRYSRMAGVVGSPGFQPRVSSVRDSPAGGRFPRRRWNAAATSRRGCSENGAPEPHDSMARASSSRRVGAGRVLTISSRRPVAGSHRPDRRCSRRRLGSRLRGPCSLRHAAPLAPLRSSRPLDAPGCRARRLDRS